jgi:hypothetical protein
LFVVRFELDLFSAACSIILASLHAIGMWKFLIAHFNVNACNFTWFCLYLRAFVTFSFKIISPGNLC